MMLMCDFVFVFVVFFKQKTAYEMRISDWSSDVCSSDLRVAVQGRQEVVGFLARRPCRRVEFRERRVCRRVGIQHGHGGGHGPHCGAGNAASGIRSKVGHRRCRRVGHPGFPHSPQRADGDIWRSEERSVGKGGVSTVQSRMSAYLSKKKKKQKKK